MKSLITYKNIFWDFDGVIMDSMPIRDKGFEIILSEYPKDQVSLLMEYHHKNGGLSRYNKLRYFFEIIRNESVSTNKIDELANNFSKVMLDNLLDPNLLIIDSLNYIKNNYKNVNMHIVSGSDQSELRTICNYLGITKYFKSIHGSPTPKNNLVKFLIEQYKLYKSTTCLIGDSKNDFDAANENGIDFYGYNSSTLKELGFKYINSFQN